MPWVDISEAAFTLSVSERTIRNWIKTGKLEARNMGGRREVNIPDSEEPKGSRVFEEEINEGGEGQGFGMQKRLEVALIECGRVKGTLASQERMMESLSANIAELNAKLQRNERVISRRTVWCVVVAFLGILSWILTKSYSDARIAEANNTTLTKQLDMKNEHAEDIKSLHKEKDGLLAGLKTENEKRVETLRLELGKQHLQAMAGLKEELKTQAEEQRKELNGKIDVLTRERDKLNTEKITAEARLSAATSQLKLAETKLAEAEARVLELEKTRQQLETEVVRLKAGSQ